MKTFDALLDMHLATYSLSFKMHIYMKQKYISASSTSLITATNNTVLLSVVLFLCFLEGCCFSDVSPGVCVPESMYPHCDVCFPNTHHRTVPYVVSFSPFFQCFIFLFKCFEPCCGRTQVIYVLQNTQLGVIHKSTRVKSLVRTAGSHHCYLKEKDLLERCACVCTSIQPKLWRDGSPALEETYDERYMFRGALMSWGSTYPIVIQSCKPAIKLDYTSYYYLCGYKFILCSLPRTESMPLKLCPVFSAVVN